MAKLKNYKNLALITLFIVLFAMVFSLSPNIEAHAESKRTIIIYLDSISLEKEESYLPMDLIRFADGTSLKEGHSVFSVSVRNTEDGTLYLEKSIFGNYLEIKDEKGRIVTNQYDIIVDNDKCGKLHRFAYVCDSTCELCDYERETLTYHRSVTDAVYVNEYHHVGICACGGIDERQQHTIDDNGQCTNEDCMGKEVALFIKANVSLWDNPLEIYRPHDRNGYGEYEYGTYYVNFSSLDDPDDDGKIVLEDLTYDTRFVKEIVDFVETEGYNTYSFTLVGHDGSEEKCTLYANYIKDKVCMVGPFPYIESKDFLVYAFIAIAIVALLVITIVSIKRKKKK